MAPSSIIMGVQTVCPAITYSNCTRIGRVMYGRRRAVGSIVFEISALRAIPGAKDYPARKSTRCWHLATAPSGLVDQELCRPFVEGPLLRYSRRVLVQEQPRSRHYWRITPDASGSDSTIRYMSTTGASFIRSCDRMVVSRDSSWASPRTTNIIFGLRSSVHRGLCYGSPTSLSIESFQSQGCPLPAS